MVMVMVLPPGDGGAIVEELELAPFAAALSESFGSRPPDLDMGDGNRRFRDLRDHRLKCTFPVEYPGAVSYDGSSGGPVSLPAIRAAAISLISLAVTIRGDDGWTTPLSLSLERRCGCCE
jgi:hypothetical protein